MAYGPSLKSYLVDKWENETMPSFKIKTLKIKIYPTPLQKNLIDSFIDTARFVYNKTLACINNGHKPNFQDLRDLLVTEKSKKGLNEYKEFDERVSQLRLLKKETKDVDEIKSIDDQISKIHQERRIKMKDFDYTKNPNINDFELETPKDIRSNAVQQCCDAIKSGISNVRNGNIKFFKMKFKKKTEQVQTIELTPKLISIHNGNIRIAPVYFKDSCFFAIDKHNNRKIKDLEIQNNVDLTRYNNQYYLNICLKTNPRPTCLPKTVAGVDLGIRTIATVHSNDINTNQTTISEYQDTHNILNKYNDKLNILKGKPKNKHLRKKQISKIEKKKKDFVDKLHWDLINDLLSNNDIIYLGDIKSKSIVQGSKNKRLKTLFNDMKFYQLKQRLIYKSYVYGKKVILVPEHYTTKTCSCCGTINNNVGSNKVFECVACNLVTGRDINASKNMKMKGMLKTS